MFGTYRGFRHKYPIDEYKFVDSIEGIYGFRNTTLILERGYYLNPAWRQKRVIESYCAQHNIKIELGKGD